MRFSILITFWFWFGATNHSNDEPDRRSGEPREAGSWKLEAGSWKLIAHS